MKRIAFYGNIFIKRDEQKNTIAESCKMYGISRPSFYNFLKRCKKVRAG